MVPPIANPTEQEERKETDPQTPSWYGSAYTKLHIWALIEYSQIFYIDADCLIVGELDHVFSKYESFDFAACPDVFPPDHFNAGVLLVRPSMRVFTKLLEETRKVHHSYDGGDTGFLNSLLQTAWFSRTDEGIDTENNISSNISSVNKNAGVKSMTDFPKKLDLKCSRLPFGYNA